MVTVFGDEQSGNCLKVKWLLDYLGHPYAWEHVDVLAGGARTEAFRQMNQAGQVPVVRLDDGRTIAQSTDIVIYFCADPRSEEGRVGKEGLRTCRYRWSPSI